MKIQLQLTLFYLLLSLSCKAQDRILTKSTPFIHTFESIDAEVLSDFIKTIAEDKTVIGLGEVSHYTKECYELKHQIILELMDQGFNGLVLEVDYGQALLWNDYVVNGTGDLDTLIASTGWFTYRTEEFKKLIADIRQFNLSNESVFQIYGMEMTAVNHNITWMKNYLKPTGLANKELIDVLTKERKTIAFQSYSENEIKDYWELYFMLNNFLTEKETILMERTSPEAFSIALRIVEIIRQFATYISQDDFYLQVGFRDQFSMQNLLWNLGKQEEERRIVL